MPLTGLDNKEKIMSEKDNKYGQGFRDYGAGVGAGALIGAGAGEAVYQKGKKYPHTGGPKSSPFIYRDAKKGVPGTKFDPPVNPKTGRPYGKGTQTYKKAEKKAVGRPGHSGMPMSEANIATITRSIPIRLTPPSWVVKRNAL
jgi:hypothetical protein